MAILQDSKFLEGLKPNANNSDNILNLQIIRLPTRKRPQLCRKTILKFQARPNQLLPCTITTKIKQSARVLLFIRFSTLNKKADSASQQLNFPLTTYPIKYHA